MTLHALLLGEVTLPWLLIGKGVVVQRQTFRLAKVAASTDGQNTRHAIGRREDLVYYVTLIEAQQADKMNTTRLFELADHAKLMFQMTTVQQRVGFLRIYQQPIQVALNTLYLTFSTLCTLVRGMDCVRP